MNFLKRLFSPQKFDHQAFIEHEKQMLYFASLARHNLGGWKHPDGWTGEDIHNLVLNEVGVDETVPRGYQLLILLWKPAEVDANGLYATDQEVKNTTQSTMIGKVLRMGQDAFQDTRRFPSGPLVTYGEWAIFRGSERQRIRKNGHDLAFVNDDRFLGVDTNPASLQTHFDLQFEFSGQ